MRSARRHHILIGTKSGQRHTSQGHASRPHPEIHTPHQPAAWTSGRQQLKPQCSGEVTQLCARRAGREGGGCTLRSSRAVPGLWHMHSSLCRLSLSIPFPHCLRCPSPQNVSLNLDLFNQQMTPASQKHLLRAPPLTDLAFPRSHAIVLNIVVVANCICVR